MSTENVVSIVVPPAILAEALDHVTQALYLLNPYLVALTPEERHDLSKMSDKSVAFVTKALQYAETNPQFAPGYLSIPDLQIDVQAVQDLTSVENPANSLAMQLNDTIMKAGSEAMQIALVYYSSVKRASEENAPGAKAIYDDLKVRFEKRKTVVTPAAAPVASSAETLN